MVTPVLLALLLAVLVLALYLRHRAVMGSHFHRLAAKLDGPRPLPLVGNAFDIAGPFATSQELLRGGVRTAMIMNSLDRIWIGPYLIVLVTDPRHIEVILGSTVEIKKSFNYKFLDSWLGQGLLTAYGTRWRKHRKIITQAFHFKILEDFLLVFNKNAKIMVKKLKKEVNGPEFDIYRYVGLCALDVISESAMGVCINAQENSESEYVLALTDVANTFVKRTVSPWLFSNFLYSISPTGRKEKKALSVVHSTTERVIKTRREELRKKTQLYGTADCAEDDIGIKKRPAFLDLLLSQCPDGTYLTDLQVREEVDTFMFEGHDTTAATISFALFSLATNPDVQAAALAEVDSVLGDSTRDITSRDLQEMRYIDRVVKEVLRLYPIIPLFARELIEDVNIDGKVLPAFTNVVVSPLRLHRMEQYYPDPLRFDPDRFLPENCLQRHPYQYLPFSAGARNCIGQKFAMMEIKAIVSTVLRHYRLLPCSNPDIYDDLTWEIVLKAVTGMKVRLEEREPFHMRNKAMPR